MNFTAGNGAVRLLRTVWSALSIAGVAAAWRLLSLRSPLVLAVAAVWAGGWIYVARWARSLGGTVTSHTVYVRYGLVWKREILIPVTALRAVELWTPPLHRVFRCRTAVLRFAGGAVRVPFLSAAEARQLCALLEKAEEY